MKTDANVWTCQRDKDSVAELQLQRSPETCRVRMKQTSAPRPLSTKTQRSEYNKREGTCAVKGPTSAPGGDRAALPSPRSRAHAPLATDRLQGYPICPSTRERLHARTQVDGGSPMRITEQAGTTTLVRPSSTKRVRLESVTRDGGRGRLGSRDAHLPPQREILCSTFRAPSTPQIPEVSPAHFLTKYHPQPHSRPTPSPAHNPIPTQPPSNIDTHTPSQHPPPLPPNLYPTLPFPQHPVPHPPPHYPTTTQRTRHTDPR